MPTDTKTIVSMYPRTQSIDNYSKHKTMKSEFNNQQSNKLNWIERLSDLDRIEELNDAEAARVSGGYSIERRANALYKQMMEKQVSFKEAVEPFKTDKDNAGKR